MQQIKVMFKQFLREPLWFRILIISMLIISIVFSNSSFPSQYQTWAKFAAAIFFTAYGFKLKRIPILAAVFFVIAILCIYLA